MVHQARELRHDDAQVLRAVGHGEAAELLDREGVGPVVRHRTQVVEPVGVGHRRQVAGALGDLLVVAVEVTENGLELHDALAVERHDHAEYAVGGRVLRSHRDLEEVAVEFIVHRADGRTCRAAEGTGCGVSGGRAQGVAHLGVEAGLVGAAHGLTSGCGAAAFCGAPPSLCELRRGSSSGCATGEG